MSYTTLRKELKDAGFDFKKGTILYQPILPNGRLGQPNKNDLENIITMPRSVLDTEFYSGYGLAEMPRFIAEDDDYIYMPSQYDGSTSIFRARKDIGKYIGTKELLPYPGGS